MNKIILDLCSGTGNWSQPYKDDSYQVLRVELKNGMDARLFPSLPSTEKRTPTQFEDIRPLIGRVHGILAAPECTVFSVAGSSYPRSTGRSQPPRCLHKTDTRTQTQLVGTRKPKG